MVSAINRGVSFFTAPCSLGKKYFQTGWEGKRVDVVGSANQKKLGMLARAGYIAAGILLRIPIINLIALAILKCCGAPMFECAAPPRRTQRVEPAPKTKEKELVMIDPPAPKPKEKELVLMPYDSYVPPKEPAVSQEEYEKRKKALVSHFQGTFAKAKGYTDHVKGDAPTQSPKAGRGLTKRSASVSSVPTVIIASSCAQNILSFDWHASLEKCDGTRDPILLVNLSRDLDAPSEITNNLECCLKKYSCSGLTDEQQAAKQMLSRLHDFCLVQIASTQDGERSALNALIRNALTVVVDAHLKDPDQLGRQLESLMIDLFGSLAIAKNPTMTARARLMGMAAHQLSFYKTRLIETTYKEEYPQGKRGSEIVGLVKRAIEGDAQEGGEVEHIRSIFVTGRATDRTYVPSPNPFGEYEELETHRLTKKYDPKHYLLDSLKEPNPEKGSFCSELRSWAGDYFNLDVDDDLTKECIQKISGDSEGPLTSEAILFLLKEAGILTQAK